MLNPDLEDKYHSAETLTQGKLEAESDVQSHSALEQGQGLIHLGITRPQHRAWHGKGATICSATGVRSL